MSVEVKGVHQMLRQIDEAYGETKMLRAQDKALNKGAKYFVSVLKANFEVFRDTGASISEITVTDPYFIHGRTRMVKVHWQGSKNRYAIIHLNEWGSIKHPNPRGKGAIARTMFMTERPYREIIKQSLEGDL
ncbi:hypothetical protein [Staphylococcus haemolyticus]|uniref:hypothetical protein n=1 Tax=Staphylococcus haemolyticus TaxID=1283 RepID=UPI000E768E49|nr:hypothetical protein [Staphylococcus haemolyticus]MDU0441533.1 hypothetical protein [Staphylococcus haemolyticus]MDU0473651.1 hypothetical protein [Staphylococcus haemolyticus]QFU26180.1 hypothetical protein D5R78_004020 [Staphylococcus haemolyticus]